MKFRTIIGITLLASAALVLIGAPSAASATAAPFTTDLQGVSLPDGQTFPDGGHVNIHADAPHVDLHFEAKCIERTDAECAGALHDAAQYIGKSSIPWAAFGLTAPACVTWVQVAGIPYHFPDLGESFICLGGTPSTPSPNPSPSPSATSTPTSTPEPTSFPSSTPSSPPTSNTSNTPSAPINSPALTATSPGDSAPIETAPGRLAETGLARIGTVPILSVIAFALGAIGLVLSIISITTKRKARR